MTEASERIASVEAERCPCGSGDVYGSCCGRYHARFVQDGELTAPTAEALMRSRYTAFALASEGAFPEAEAYLLATWAPESRPAELALDAPGQGPDADLDWVRLQIEQVQDGGPFHDVGSVTFTAHYRTPGGSHTQRERSQFVRRGGVWLYRNGDVG